MLKLSIVNLDSTIPTRMPHPRCALINMFGWFMTSLVYYMLWFSAKSLAGDIYVNAAILGLAELPGSPFHNHFIIIVKTLIRTLF